MVQDGPPSPKTTTSHLWNDDSAVTNYMRGPDNNSIPSLLLTCAQNDRGGGVSLNYVFAIYSTARLPAVWTAAILHATPSAEEIYTERLQTLANKISVSLPIYTSWDDVQISSESHESHQIQSLNVTPPSSSTTTTYPPFPDSPIARQIGRQKPHFLLNAALHARHCIIGYGSITETLFVVLRRPWCVLEICVSNLHDTNVLEDILAFARTAQELDHSGYSTAVFLLEYEIVARGRHRCCCCQEVARRGWFSSHISERKPQPQSVRMNPRSFGKDSDLPLKHSSSRQTYEMCNTVFLPSLKSFNSFWIRLICVSAIEIGVSFSCMINMLCCDQKHDQNLHKQQQQQQEQARFVPAGTDTGLCQHGRRQSEIRTSSLPSLWRSQAKDEDRHSNEVGEDIVEKMLEVYTNVLRRTGDYI